MPRDLEPVDPFEDILYCLAGFGGQWTLLDYICDDSLDERNLCVLEALEAPSIEFDAKNIIAISQCVINHLQDARFARAPIAVHADRDSLFRPFREQVCNRLGDGLVIEEIHLRFVVC